MNRRGYIAPSQRDDANTPPELVAAVREALGGTIDLDPCSNASSMVEAKHNWMLANLQDGLKQPWGDGRTVFVNSPFGVASLRRWCKKIWNEHTERGAEVVQLLPSATETEHWQEYVARARAVCFLRGRVVFWVDGKPYENGSGKGSALVYYGRNAMRFCNATERLGMLVRP